MWCSSGIFIRALTFFNVQLYINHLPQCSQFTTTLFADDPHLNLADKNLLSLEKKVNMKMDNVKNWLIENKLTLNFSKFCYLLINKNPKQIVSSAFNISIDRNKIERFSSTLKRLPSYLHQIDLKVGSYMPTSRLLSLLRGSHISHSLKSLRLT